MEEKDFENNIREAFKRLERETLKAKIKAWEQDIISDEMVFENNIIEASKRIERDRLKKLLQKTEQNIEPLNEKKLIIFNNRWWQYAVAACLVLGLSFYFIFQAKNNEPTLAHSTQPVKDSIVNNKIEDLNNDSKDIVVRSSQNDVITTSSFNLTIKTENLGFGNTDKLKGQVIVDKTVKSLLYTFKNNSLTLKSFKGVKVRSVVNYEDNIYININNNFYLVSPSTAFTLLRPISDNELIEKIGKIDLTQ